MREAILLFGAEDKLAVHLRKTLAPLKVQVRPIPPEEYHRSLGNLAGDKTCPAGDSPFPGPALDQPMLLFAGFSDARMEQALVALRRSGLYFDYKAVLTPTNRLWTVPDLYREIVREHRELHSQP